MPRICAQRDAAHREAQVADDRGLRIAGRARRVDVEEHVAAADVGDVGLRRRVRYAALAERGGTSGGVVVPAGASAWKRTGVRARDLGDAPASAAAVADAARRAGRAQDVREPGAGHVRVQERADRAELRDGADRREEEGTVPREDRDRLPGAHAVAREHPREAVHVRVVTRRT